MGLIAVMGRRVTALAFEEPQLKAEVGVDPGGAAGHASFNDTINNVEAVFIPAGTFVANQAVGVNVVGISVPQGLSNGSQTFSIYAYNLR